MTTFLRKTIASPPRCRLRAQTLAGCLSLLILAACGTTEATSTGAAARAVPSTSGADATTTGAADGSDSAATTLAAASHYEEADLVWDEATEVDVTLSGDTASASAGSVEIDAAASGGTTVTITEPGTYRIAGRLDDGQLAVASDSEGIVRLVLDGVDVHSATTAALAVLDADEVVVFLEGGTENRLSDEAGYVFPDAGTDEPNATLFSAADLTVAGTGSLTVAGSYGIASKDGLVLAGGQLSVTAVDDGIRGKDYLVALDSTVVVDAGGDGLKADNAEDAALGFITVSGGDLEVVAGGDGFDAETSVLVTHGTIAVTAGGGSTGTVAADASAKAIKGSASVTIEGGELTLDSADDALHSNGTVEVKGGDVQIATGDDGVHADGSVTVDDGTVTIIASYEGIEGGTITINGGSIATVSSDDGINVSSGNDGSREMGGGPPDTFAAGSGTLNINGGTITVDAGGDGVDVNGSITMTAGSLLVDGPTEQMNGALDYDGTFDLSGGTLVATGSSGMVMAPSSPSTQPSLLATFPTQEGGTTVQVESTDGATIATFTPAKAYASIVVSSADIDEADTYEVSAGGQVVATTTTAAASSGGGGPRRGGRG